VRAKLTGLHTATKRLAGGRVCVYAYTARGGPLLAKGIGRDLQAANAALEAELGSAACLHRLAELKEETKRLRPKQSDRYVFGLVTGFFASPEFAKLAASTQASYRDYLERFRDEFGEDPISMFEKPRAVEDLTEWRDEMADTPRAADYAMSAVGRLFAWARSRGKTSAEPTKDIGKLHSANRADVIWTDADILKFCRHASVDLQNAVKLAAYTGLRQGDLLRLPWSAVSEFSITVRTSKRKRLAVVPLDEPARALIAAIPKHKDCLTVLTSSTGKPWTADGFKASFRRAKQAALAEARKRHGPEAKSGIEHLRFHDLRGTAATRWAAAGVLTNVEIATIMGWSVERVDQLKALYVNSDVVMLDLLARMDQKRAATNRPQTGSRDESGAAE
jgi:integrase